jgi:23S rRNA (cytidine1920-2'-O)/16S rRNA (cytidine1409-2'-O)-methyltransferase
MRADKFLSLNGYYESRSKAREAIEAGLVFANGQCVSKPSETIDEAAIIEASAPYPWVSRAGLKLEHALREFQIDVQGKICLDVGSSTGGFTQVLCENGATKVYAVDVGRDQLHDKVRSDVRVISMEQRDARKLEAHDFEAPPSVIVCDVSFISCMKALEAPLALAAERADLVTLVKPQFEVGREGVGKGGIVHDQKLALKSVERVKRWLVDLGWQVMAEGMSPIKGGSGNTEYLIHAERG